MLFANEPGWPMCEMLREFEWGFGVAKQRGPLMAAELFFGDG